MAVLLLAASLLAVMSGCAQTQEAVFSELDLYASDVWRAGRRAVLVREQGECWMLLRSVHLSLYAHKVAVVSEWTNAPSISS